MTTAVQQYVPPLHHAGFAVGWFGQYKHELQLEGESQLQQSQ